MADDEPLGMIAILGRGRAILYRYRQPLLLLGLLIGGYGVIRLVGSVQALNDPRNQAFIQWWRGSPATREALVTVQREVCPGAPFILPADGYIGLLYGDPRGPYSRSRPHQGIDIFSNSGLGETPVYAAYDGYISREPGWKSSLIQRVPDDPLQPGRQIWLYYTHLADAEGNDFIAAAFPPGSREQFVTQGTLLGYTGNYSGNSLRPVGIHLHFSIVLDDGNGYYLNELQFANTIDPSPYLGMMVNHACAAAAVQVCQINPGCE
ncbi:MAG: peptidoglycan DD-metalloendopeptidase family protein [Anaerolineae bacterium]|nr:peptidoglycan DD-metalloendopeptidase family protein [Anaerolineae bacterium]